MLWDIMLCSLLKVNQCFWGTYCLHLQLKNEPSKKSGWKFCLSPAFTLVSCLAYSSTLKMEAVCFSKTVVDFQRTTWHYIPEDSNLHNHLCENLKFYKSLSVWKQSIYFLHSNWDNLHYLTLKTGEKTLSLIQENVTVNRNIDCM
jgi:hypothetical protein